MEVGYSRIESASCQDLTLMAVTERIVILIYDENLDQSGSLDS